MLQWMFWEQYSHELLHRGPPLPAPLPQAGAGGISTRSSPSAAPTPCG
ncbi:hypothetical protein ACU4GA_06765 [Methylobacterium oryzae CBMB20]